MISGTDVIDTDLKSVKEARIKKRMSLQRAALATGISRDRLVFFENNPDKIPLQIAISLSNIYGMEIDEISFSK